MSIRFILVLFLTGISVTIFFFFMGNSFKYADTSELVLTNLLYQNDYILYLIYILIRFNPFKDRQAFILLLIYCAFLCNGIAAILSLDLDMTNTIYVICECSVRALFSYYFIKYLNLDFKQNKLFLFIAASTILSSLVIFCIDYEIVGLFKMVTIVVFYAVITTYLIVGSSVSISIIRNKVFFSFGVLFTFISDFFTILNLYFQVEVYMFTFLRLISVIGEFLVIYVILEELKSKTKYQISIKH